MLTNFKSSLELWLKNMKIIDDYLEISRPCLYRFILQYTLNSIFNITNP